MLPDEADFLLTHLSCVCRAFKAQSFALNARLGACWRYSLYSSCYLTLCVVYAAPLHTKRKAWLPQYEGLGPAFEQLPVI